MSKASLIYTASSRPARTTKILVSKKKIKSPGVVAGACNPSSWKIDTYQVPGYLKHISKDKILNLHPIINTESLLDVSKKL